MPADGSSLAPRRAICLPWLVSIWVSILLDDYECSAVFES
jgi:hypothetical protein